VDKAVALREELAGRHLSALGLDQREMRRIACGGVPKPEVAHDREIRTRSRSEAQPGRDRLGCTLGGG
jgi:hypothetical protein